MVGNVSEENSLFWNELCGTQLARTLAISDNSKESLAKFDDWFMGFYPYLSKYIPFQELRGKKVLEVGLGYGTVAQKIAEAGADYHALDIAQGPVNMVNHRLGQAGLLGEAKQGSILQAPFAKDTFDWVFAVGCYHHTGNMQQAVDETWRILKPGGCAMIMVYNALSYRRWIWSFMDTWKYFIRCSKGDFSLFDTRPGERAQYDTNEKGDAAPHTDFFSASHIRQISLKWNKVSVSTENVGDESVLRWVPRGLKLSTLGRISGLDIYCTLQK